MLECKYFNLINMQESNSKRLTRPKNVEHPVRYELFIMEPLKGHDTHSTLSEVKKTKLSFFCFLIFCFFYFVFLFFVFFVFLFFDFLFFCFFVFLIF